jgi:hypothetical protein
MDNGDSEKFKNALDKAKNVIGLVKNSDSRKSHTDFVKNMSLLFESVIDLLETLKK